MNHLHGAEIQFKLVAEWLKRALQTLPLSSPLSMQEAVSSPGTIHERWVSTSAALTSEASYSTNDVRN